VRLENVSSAMLASSRRRFPSIDAFMISVGGHPAALPADLTDIERAATPAPKPITG
jgi:hypothetical protein